MKLKVGRGEASQHVIAESDGEACMTLECFIGDRIFETVRKYPACQMDDLVSLFPDLTWNQVLLEVNQLRLNRRLLMIANGQGSFVVSPTG